MLSGSAGVSISTRKKQASQADRSPPPANLTAVFDENIALTGSGTVTILNMDDGTGSSDIAISLPDDQVSVSGNQLIINPVAYLEYSTNYAVQISSDAIVDLADTPNAFAGILDETTWNFAIGDVPPFITPVVVTATSSHPEALVAKIIDSSGLSENSAAGTHENNANAATMWLLDGGNVAAAEVVFDLGGVYDLSQAYVWNQNQSYDSGGTILATLRAVETMDI